MVNVADQLRHDEDIRLLVLGNGLLQREIAQQIFQRELANVTLSDVIAKGKMAELLNASDACLATLRDIPMFRMTYPNKVFDYMAAGRPVVLAIDGVIRDVVASANGGICVPPGDAKAIADAIRYLRDHPAEAQSMGHSGFKYVAKHFHRDDHARLLEQTLEEVAA